METSTIISLASLLIALLALPTSYWVAVRQVKVGLDEHDRWSKLRARLLVADALDEFFKVFYGAVKELTGIQPHELQRRLNQINPQMQDINAFVEKTQVLARLAVAIDNLSATGFADLPQSSSDVVEKLQSIRNQIVLGSDAKRYATLGVIAACGGADLQAALRKENE